MAKPMSVVRGSLPLPISAKQVAYAAAAAGL